MKLPHRRQFLHLASGCCGAAGELPARTLRKREENMSWQRRDFLLAMILTAVAAAPAFGQAVVPMVGSYASGERHLPLHLHA